MFDSFLPSIRGARALRLLFQNCVMSSDNCEEPSSKRPCPDGASSQESLLPEFKPVRVLSADSRSKSAVVLGDIRESPALVLLEKNAFTEELLCSRDAYFSDRNAAETRLNFTNDVYAHLECYPLPQYNGVKATIIYPATERHISRYGRQQRHLILETPQLYEELTLPYIEKEHFSLQWIYHILEGKSEQERVIYDSKCETDGFVLVPDLKWDGNTKETLYVLAIVRRRGIRSLRDLDGGHLDLLKRIRDEGKKAILEKYGVSGSQLRVYLHYQPSFYHLHVHFSYIQHEPPGIFTEKSHMIDTVISNLQLMPDYYHKVSIPFTVKETEGLFKVYEEKGLVQRVD